MRPALWLGTTICALFFLQSILSAGIAMVWVPLIASDESADMSGLAQLGYALTFAFWPLSCVAAPIAAWSYHSAGRPRAAGAVFLLPIIYPVAAAAAWYGVEE